MSVTAENEIQCNTFTCLGLNYIPSGKDRYLACGAKLVSVSITKYIGAKCWSIALLLVKSISVRLAFQKCSKRNLLLR